MAQPIQFDGKPRQVTAPPPRLGEHSEAVLAAFGHSPAEIAALRAAGALGPS
jgi:alpha-methylacyl-CoA racemase